MEKIAQNEYEVLEEGQETDLPPEESDGPSFGQRLGMGMAKVQECLETTDKKVRHFVSERPLTALFTAVGLGYLIGKIVAKWRSQS